MEPQQIIWIIAIIIISSGGLYTFTSREEDNKPGLESWIIFAWIVILFTDFIVHGIDLKEEKVLESLNKEKIEKSSNSPIKQKVKETNDDFSSNSF